MNGKYSAITRIGKYGDEHMFFDIEWTWVQREFPAGPLKESPVRDLGGHEPAEWDNGDLSWNCCDRQRLRTIPKELVKEG